MLAITHRVNVRNELLAATPPSPPRVIKIIHLLRHARADPGRAFEVVQRGGLTFPAVPKCSSSARLREGPIPGISSSGEAVIARLRLARWAPMA